MSHTETPWQICANDPAGIEDSHGNMNLFVSGDVTSITEDKANAAYIVECVNAHEALTRQNEALQSDLLGIAAGLALAEEHAMLSDPCSAASVIRAMRAKIDAALEAK